MAEKRTVTILSTADFASDIWTNKQHLASGLSKSHHVVYIDSMGLRAPTFSRADLGRIAQRLMRKSDRPRGTASTRISTQDTIQVVPPRVIPFHGSRPVRFINGLLLRRQVLAKIPASNRDVLWSFSPLTYGLEKHFSTVVYHSVDLLHTFPGVPKRALLSAETHLLPECDAVIASSAGVAAHLNALGAMEVTLWENVADTELYAAKSSASPRPRAIFSGNLTPTKIDFDLLEKVIESGIELAIAGPVSIDGTDGVAQIGRLLQHPNVTYLGTLDREQLAYEVGNSQVGLIPYALNTNTEGVFPMKVYEYLAAGLAVVSTPLKSLTSRGSIDGLALVEARQFAEAVEQAIRDYSLAAAADRKLSAVPHSWTSRTKEAEALLQAIAG